MSRYQNVEAPIHECMLIGGQPVDGAARIEVRNPARPDDLVGTIVRGTPEHVNAAVAAAKSASRPGRRKPSPHGPRRWQKRLAVWRTTSSGGLSRKGRQ